MVISAQTQGVGGLLREWRMRRRMSQLGLAVEAEISTRHLSFIETGRSVPSREMVLHLAEQLNVPLRERNSLLIAAGYAPVFGERSLNDPNLVAVRKAVDLVLTGHEPYPALALDRHWTLVASNCAVGPFLAGLEPSLLSPPINVLRLSLHPKGLAPRIVNLPEWRSHLIERLRRQIDVTADAILEELYKELCSYSNPGRFDEPAELGLAGIAVPLQLATEQGILSFLSTTTVFGTPVDITLSELAIESFFPADAATSRLLNQMFHLKKEKE